MGNSLSSPNTAGSQKFPTWSMFPKLNEYIIKGEQLPEELRDFYFGVINIERKFSNVEPVFVQYTRAVVNCIAMLEDPFLEATSKEETNIDQLKNFFASEINNANIEIKAMSGSLQAVDGFFFKTYSTTILKQEHDIKQRNIKGSWLNKEAE